MKTVEPEQTVCTSFPIEPVVKVETPTSVTIFELVEVPIEVIKIVEVSINVSVMSLAELFALNTEVNNRINVMTGSDTLKLRPGHGYGDKNHVHTKPPKPTKTPKVTVTPKTPKVMVSATTNSKK